MSPKHKRRALRKKRASHPLYAALMETGLFEDEDGVNASPNMFFARLRLIGTSYIYRFSLRKTDFKEWALYQKGELPQPTSFENIFENVSSEIKERLIWHLDLVS